MCGRLGGGTVCSLDQFEGGLSEESDFVYACFGLSERAEHA